MDPNEFYSYFPKDKGNFILIDFFLFIPDMYFKKILEYISNKNGYGDEAISISFPSDFQEWEEEYFKDGVMVTVREKELFVSDEIFLEYTNIAIKLYLKNHPEDIEEVKSLYSKIKNSFS